MGRTLSDLAAACIQCGFCLESCPTFRLTGDETHSPRGRIALARAADNGTITWSEAEEGLDTCLGCRACETACPSGVQYGDLLELARQHTPPNKPTQLLLNTLANPQIFRSQALLAHLAPGKRVPGPVSQAIAHQPPEAEIPTLPNPTPWPALEGKLPPVKGEVGLLVGCVMGVLYPDVHEATRRLLRRVGFEARDIKGCCGALHAHAGMPFEPTLPATSLPLIVNSAGCGSHLKHSAHDSREATTFLAENGLADLLARSPGFPPSAITYHDACHLAHGQGVRQAPRDLIAAIPGVTLVELKDADHCCGSAGIYNITHPATARDLLEQKYANVAATGASIVATGNPGCHAWIAQAAREHGC